MAFIIPAIPAAGGAGAAIAGFLGAKALSATLAAAATKAAQLAVVYFGGELLSRACVRAGADYKKTCVNFYDDIQCVLMKSSVMTACGGAAAAYVISGKFICDAAYPGKCNLESLRSGKTPLSPAK